MNWGSDITKVGKAITEQKNYSPDRSDIVEEEEEVNNRRISDSQENLEKEEIVDVQEGKAAEIEAFVDGRQKTFCTGHIEVEKLNVFLPIHYHLSGAVGVDENLNLRKSPEVKQGLIIYNSKFLSKRVIRILEKSNIEIKESRKRKENEELDYRDLRNRGTIKSSNMRDELEQSIIDEIDNSGFMAKDGTLPQFKEYLEDNSLFGIVKNHYTRYLSQKNERKIAKMNVGQRSWAFKMERQSVNLCSWYLKIRDVGGSPLSGIVRIETNIENKENIDEISRSVLKHRLPVKRNITSWESQIYPYHVCEKSVNSALPSKEEVESALKGLGVVS